MPQIGYNEKTIHPNHDSGMNAGKLAFSFAKERSRTNKMTAAISNSIREKLPEKDK